MRSWLAGARSRYHLVTTATTSAQSIADGSEGDPVVTRTGYAAVVAGDPTGWSLGAPTSTSTDVTNTSNVTSTLTAVTRYDSLGRTIETRLPGATGSADPRSTVTSYYSATGTGACVSAALAGLVCSTGPGAQPGTGNPLPVKTATYDFYGQPLTAVETAGSTVRTTTATYDAAERPVASAVTVTPTAAGGTAVPTVTTGYQATTGLPVTKATTAATLTTGYDTQGRVTSYTDATGTVSTTSYDIDSRPSLTNDGKANTTYAYDTTTGEHRGLLTSKNVSSGFGTAASTFTASYDPDARLAVQTWPNGLAATAAYDNAGTKIALTYAKSGTTWMAFTQTPGTRGTVGLSSPQSAQVFGYDQVGRLISTADTVTAGSTKACTTRRYTLDADSNRSSLVSTPDDGTDTTNGHCSTSTTATTTSSTFDQADRITNTGYTYDTLGRTTAVPASDAQGINSQSGIVGTLSVGYYANDMVASENHGSSAFTYTLDPLQNRTLSQTSGSTTTTYAYSSDSDSPEWSSTSTSFWTRNLTGPDGLLDLVQVQSGSITYRLHNLHGDVVATSASGGSSTGISDYSESTEFGAPRVPANGYRPYGYLGGQQRSDNALGGVILMGVRLYNPATARFLSVDRVYGGNDNPYVYSTDPTDESDLSGQCNWFRHFARCMREAIASRLAGQVVSFLSGVGGRILCSALSAGAALCGAIVGGLTAAGWSILRQWAATGHVDVMAVISDSVMGALSGAGFGRSVAERVRGVLLDKLRFMVDTFKWWLRA